MQLTILIMKSPYPSRIYGIIVIDISDVSVTEQRPLDRNIKLIFLIGKQANTENIFTFNFTGATTAKMLTSPQTYVVKPF